MKWQHKLTIVWSNVYIKKHCMSMIEKKMWSLWPPNAIEYHSSLLARKKNANEWWSYIIKSSLFSLLVCSINQTRITYPSVVPICKSLGRVENELDDNIQSLFISIHSIWWKEEFLIQYIHENLFSFQRKIWSLEPAFITFPILSSDCLDRNQTVVRENLLSIMLIINLNKDMIIFWSASIFNGIRSKFWYSY